MDLQRWKSKPNDWTRPRSSGAFSCAFQRFSRDILIGIFSHTGIAMGFETPLLTPALASSENLSRCRDGERDREAYRPRQAIEREHLGAIGDVVTLDDWREFIRATDES